MIRLCKSQSVYGLFNFFTYISATEQLIQRRKTSPTVLTADGKIAGPSRSARRRRAETISAAKMLYGAGTDNMAPAYEGLVAVLNENAPVAMLANIMKKYPKFKKKVIPKIVNEEIRSFENSDKNFVRSVNILYKGGIASKQKYNAIRSSLTMCLDETGLTRKHIHFMKNISVPKLVTYKKLLQRVNQINIGELNDVRETLCYEMEEENKVNGKYGDLLQLLLKMAHFYLSANKHRNDKLNWFGKQEVHLKSL